MPGIVVPPSLTDGRVALRPLAEGDVPAYVAAFREDGELGRLLGIERDPDEQGLLGRLARLDELREQAVLVELAIAETAADRFAGSLTLHSLDRVNRRGELGFFVVPDARRRGIARAAVELALGWMFGGLGLERAEMTTTPDNEAVAALAARLGFTREGVLRARNLERGRRVDVVMFGLLRHEWRVGHGSARPTAPPAAS